MTQKLAIIDGNSILYREFFALPVTLKNAEGQPTNAIYGFANAIIKLIKDLEPTHIVIAFDASKKTFRNEIYSEYKAFRKPMPEELRAQLEPLKLMLSKMNIKCLEKIGLEGDDIIGTISDRFDVETFIVTGDRDCFQLVDHNTKIYRTLKGVSQFQIMDEKTLDELYGLKPKQLIDLKALQGDASDNIPGAKGVGEKTALTLMKKYGSVENLYDNIDEVSGKMGENLRNSKDLVFVSKKLAEINCNVDIECKLDECTYDFPFNESVRDFMQKNNFRTILKRDDIFATSTAQTIEKKESSKKLVKITTLSNLLSVRKKIEKVGMFSFYFDDSSYMLSDGVDEYRIEFVEDLTAGEITKVKFWEMFSVIFNSEKIGKIFFDSKSTLHLANEFGVEIGDNYFDCMIARHLIDGNSVNKINDVFLSMDLDESNIALSLFESKALLEKSFDTPELKNLYYKIELPLARVLFEMEVAGFKVDTEKLDELSKIYKAELDDLVKKIHLFAGREFNVNSPKQLGEILYDELKLAKSKKKSTNIVALEFMEKRHPIIPLVIRFRTVSKLLSTYIEGLRPHLDVDNFIHTTFKQTLTTTGRLSSTKPNLQNIPIRTKESREIRSIFTASTKEHVLIDADYSQIELRLLAHLSFDEKLTKAYLNDEDIHTQTASTIFKVATQEVTPEMRRTAKVVNFGVNYGISDFGLASDLKISPKEAKVYIEEYFESHPKVAEYMQKQIEIAREKGYVTTMFGRTRKMMDIKSSNYLVRTRAERASQNMPLQGSAADIIKIAMININKRLKKDGFKAKLIMQVHDELIVDCPISESEKVRKLVDFEMENVTKLRVPLIADTEVSYRWSEGH